MALTPYCCKAAMPDVGALYMADICPPEVPAMGMLSAVLSTPPVRQTFQMPMSLRPPIHSLSLGSHPLPIYSMLYIADGTGVRAGGVRSRCFRIPACRRWPG